MKRRLIFNADDYGLSPAVSRGILEAMRTGVVRSTTVMANFATGEEVDKLKTALAEDAGSSQPAGLTAGAHLNLSTGPPLTSDYPGLLLRDGPAGQRWFDKQRALAPGTWTDRDLVVFAAVEWAAQLALLREGSLPLSHLDSHHHIHLQPALFPIALDLAQQHGLALRVRRDYRSLARGAEITCPDTLLEGYFGENNISRQALLALLAGAKGDTVEVMCHPGQLDDLVRQRSGYLAEREKELQVLGDPGLVTELTDLGWQLQGYVWNNEEHAAH
jgi:predicted glycoside hydrolase/deacetylase ChbG (UPF0249 family)